jgi:HEAT repeat protein
VLTMKRVTRIGTVSFALATAIFATPAQVAGQDSASGKTPAEHPQSRPHGPASKGIRIRIPELEDQLKFEGFEPNEEGLKQALASGYWARVVAIRIIKQRKAANYSEDLARQLGHDEVVVRVEAATALATFGDPRGVAALKQELERARRVQQKVLAGIEPLLGKNAIDLGRWMQAAGALADAGDSSGYDVVRLSVLSLGPDGSASIAAHQMPKFARFKHERIDVLPVLLQAMERALKQIDEKIAKASTAEITPEDVYCGDILKALGQVGGAEALAKIQSATKHKRSHVRLTAQGVLDEMKPNGQPPQPPDDNVKPVNISPDGGK